MELTSLTAGAGIGHSGFSSPCSSVLQVSEILRLIFENVHGHDVQENDRDRLNDLSSLARTCKLFKDPALDALWSTQTSLLPLFRLVSSALENDHDPVALEEAGVSVQDTLVRAKRPFNEAEWSTLSKYSAKVRAFRRRDHIKPPDELDPKHVLDTSCFYELFKRDSTSLFPNLRTFHWPLEGVSFNNVVFGNRFIGDRLEVVDLQLRSRNVETFILDSIKHRCVRLKELVISSPSHWPLQSGIWDVLHAPAAAALKIFHCEVPMDPQLCPVLACLPLLEDMRMTLPDPDDAVAFASLLRPLTHLQNPFLSLRLATIFTPSVAIVAKLLEVIKFTRLKSLSLVFHKADALPPSSQDLVSLLRALVKNIKHDILEDIRFLQGTGVHGSVWDEDGPVIHSNVFKCLTTFKNIKHFDVCVPWGIRFDDDLLRDLAPAWPKLETIAFEPSAPWPTPIPVTFAGIEALVKYCPALREITTRIHAEGDSMDHDRLPASGRSACRVRTLCVGKSTITDSTHVAMVLSSLFPNLKTIVAGPDEGEMRDEEEMESQEKWEVAGELVPLFVGVRAQERGRANRVAQMFDARANATKE
ncbi:hypothetical protein EIP91_006235 [Steccherinum ochraceum]|uniref:F-box domain-containing protein n=1 Tax=Steccherinum ochraceum TaxID=92696 RepID=A0A4R0RGS8_9APHY|nr:hypothetical protein EIP91_006235 [Steccherinum ochraceum]